ncbi:hypothetical protein CDL12_29021 [Handroanthus impetiginosus]|uniref:Uncharacterized protein n=1 Tax=Handroanthus impetiginosus TaxID=429701 RepID=A0A2G9G0Q7_9LAMI|nr:hypothetical protein CDL12_29021 [Handroanthus impetiginosus]
MTSNPPKRQNSNLPPRRGRVKAQVFQSVAGTLSAATKAVLFLANGKRGSSPGAAIDTPTFTSASASTSTSPPASTHGSDGDPGHA